MKRLDQDKDFENIYTQYYVRMKRFAQEYVLSEEDAENILQDVFLDFWEKRDVFLDYVNVIAFLFTAIKNRSINLINRRLKESEITANMQEEYMRTLQVNLESLQSMDDEVCRQEHIEELVRNAILSLPERCREIFVKNKIEGKKQKEIAAELNISVHAVETQMGIAYKKLREQLKNVYPLFLFLVC